MNAVPVRIIAAKDGWWLLHRGQAIALPSEGVRAVREGEIPTVGFDLERGRCLTDGAVEALAPSGLLKPDDVDRTYALTVLTATQCNLGCNYCFQNLSVAPEGSFAPPRIREDRLTSAQVHKISEFAERQMNLLSKEGVSLLLFGGEPLLNPAACIALLRALSPLNLVSAGMITNGALLTETLATELEEAGLGNVQITFDGAREAHDRVRVSRSGRPTYDTILTNVSRALRVAPRLNWNFRINVSHLNIDGLDDVVQDLVSVAERDWSITLTLAMIDDTGLGYENDVVYGDQAAEAFVRANRAAIRGGIRVMPSMSLSQCAYCSEVGGTRGAVINADGELYSCWENAGRKEWSVGNVTDGYAEHSLVERRWVACDFETKSHGTAVAARRFHDFVDGSALDDQEAAGLLGMAVNA